MYFCSGRQGLINRENFEAIIDSVDAVSLMTYDFSNPMKYVIIS